MTPSKVRKRYPSYTTKSGNVINPETLGCFVGFLDDDEVLQGMDDTILSASPHLSSLMACLFDRGFRPVGEMPTLLFALAHLTNSYETIRMDGGEPRESIELAMAMTLRHPVMQRMLSRQVANSIDGVARV
jgi:hypothetical protein